MTAHQRVQGEGGLVVELNGNVGESDRCGNPLGSVPFFGTPGRVLSREWG